MDLKKPMTIEEQVDRLISHNMIIGDIDTAKKTLSEINYYRFSGYALQFRNKEHPDDYNANTKFEDVLYLHNFDNRLRCVLRRFLDMVEIYARMQIAYGFSHAKCLSAPHDQHYNPLNFHNEKSHNDIFNISLDREKSNSKDALFVIHHANKYSGKMLLWVIVELMSFTNLSKLYNAMYFSEQDSIAKNVGTGRDILRNHLHCLANLRNKIAHAGRLYNITYNPPVNLGWKYRKNNPDIAQNTLFAYIIALLRRLPNKIDRMALVVELSDILGSRAECVEISRLGFPYDYQRILNNEIE